MNEKELIEIIKEIAECNKDSCKDCKSICDCYCAITLFFEKVLPEGSVVLTKEAYLNDFNNQFNKGYKHGSKETAKEILLKYHAKFTPKEVDEFIAQYGLEVKE